MLPKKTIVCLSGMCVHSLLSEFGPHIIVIDFFLTHEPTSAYRLRTIVVHCFLAIVPKTIAAFSHWVTMRSASVFKFVSLFAEL